MPRTYSFSELCHALRKPQLYVRGLQTGLDLYVPGQADRYPETYHAFMFKIVALRAANIPLDDLRELFLREKRIQEMLHVDTLTESPLWYLASCDLGGWSESRLFLTGHDLGQPIASGVLQVHLNFDGDTKGELFSGPAMGEDIREFCRSYWRTLEKLKTRILQERQALRASLNWLERVC